MNKSDNIRFTTENRYEFYEKKSKSLYNRRCIDNTITGCNKCVGYCEYSGHQGFLTENHRKQHNCIEKKCFYYIAKPGKMKTLKINLFSDISSDILQFLRKNMCEAEGIKVIRVENTALNTYKAFYVAVTGRCELEMYSLLVKQELCIDVEFIRLNYSFDRCVELLLAG